jgi:acetylornithine deacetylase
MHQNQTLNILDKLISFDTTSCHSNLAMLDYIADYLQQHGVSSQLVRDPEQPKANLYAKIGPADRAAVMLSGHTDTVPTTGQNWHYPSHQLSVEKNRAYGRGTTDMKGFIACVLAAVPQMCSADLQVPIALAFSYDEEIGCIGVRHMLDVLAQQPIKPLACIIGEPTSMQVAVAHKGKVSFKVSVKGKECHSGMAPLGVNAVNYAARLIVWLEQLAQKKRQHGPFDDNYDIPYSTVHTGTVTGGLALNIVPKDASFIFEIRNIAAEDPQILLDQLHSYAQTLIDEMRTVDGQCDIQFEKLSEYPGLGLGMGCDMSDSETAIAFVKHLVQDQQSANINFGTEAGLFSQHLGIPSVVCGPGSMDQGHKPDEYIELSQLNECDNFLSRLIQALSQENFQLTKR